MIDTAVIEINDRVYKLDGSIIHCYKIKSIDNYGGNLVLEEEPLFTIVSNTEDAAMIMDDLYQGEYDGG